MGLWGLSIEGRPPDSRDVQTVGIVKRGRCPRTCRSRSHSGCQGLRPSGRCQQRSTRCQSPVRILSKPPWTISY